MIPIGKHEATVTGAFLSESSKGTPCVQIEFDANGDTGTAWLYLSDAAFERAVKTLRDAFGFDDDFETLPDQLVGKQCQIVVEEEADDKGVLRPRVKWINPLRSAPRPLSNAEVLTAKLSAKSSRIAREVGAATRAPAPAAKPGVRAPAIKDDGVPF
jgi:hypothetical protein